MRYEIVIRSFLTQGSVEGRLTSLASGGPFRVHDLEHLGGGGYRFTLQPIRPGLAIGFGKVAELVVLLAREFEVDAVERLSISALMAAS